MNLFVSGVVLMFGASMLTTSAFAAPRYEELPRCEQRVIATNKNCAVVSTVDQDGNFSMCYCDHKGIKNSASVPFPDPVVVKNHDVTYVKVKPTDSTNPDPCVTVVQNNTVYRVCW